MTVATTIIRRAQRAVTVPMEDPEEPLRLARGSESMVPNDAAADRPTTAIDPAELRGLIGQAGGLDAEIEIVAKTAPAERATTEPPAVIVDVPPPELVQHERPTIALDPSALRALVVAPTYPVYRAGSSPWLLVAALAFALLAVVLLVI